MRIATLSNCGDVLKLSRPSLVLKSQGGQVNSLGYGKTVKDVTMDNPQPSSKDLKRSMSAVHRLDGSGCSMYVLCLRYSRSRCESRLVNKGIQLLNIRLFTPSHRGELVSLGWNASSWFLPKFPSG